MWLWPRLIQEELDHFRLFANTRKIRKQRNKILPSGVSPHYAYTFPERFGGCDCLQPVDVSIIKEILDDMKPEQQFLTDWGVPPEFAVQCADALQRIGLVEPVNLKNVWVVFNAILNVLNTL